MDLYLIRHAIAEDRRPDLFDGDRELTDEGRDRFAVVVGALKRVGVRLDRVVHSPWTRAAQTAELLAPLCDGSFEPADALATSPDVDFFRALRGESVACVGHEPWMGEAVSLLCSGKARSLDIRIKKGGVAWLRGDPGEGVMELRGLWSPKFLIWQG